MITRKSKNSPTWLQGYGLRKTYLYNTAYINAIFLYICSLYYTMVLVIRYIIYISKDQIPAGKSPEARGLHGTAKDLSQGLVRNHGCHGPEPPGRGSGGSWDMVFLCGFIVIYSDLYWFIYIYISRFISCWFILVCVGYFYSSTYLQKTIKHRLKTWNTTHDKIKHWEPQSFKCRVRPVWSPKSQV